MQPQGHPLDVELPSKHQKFSIKSLGMVESSRQQRVPKRRHFQLDWQCGILVYVEARAMRKLFQMPECTSANGARVTWDSTDGDVYTLVVFGRQAGATGNFAISVTDFVNPPNDYCQQAQSLVINGDQVIGSTINATTRTILVVVLRNRHLKYSIK